MLCQEHTLILIVNNSYTLVGLREAARRSMSQCSRGVGGSDGAPRWGGDFSCGFRVPTRKTRAGNWKQIVVGGHVGDMHSGYNLAGREEQFGELFRPAASSSPLKGLRPTFKNRRGAIAERHSFLSADWKLCTRYPITPVQCNSQDNLSCWWQVKRYSDISVTHYRSDRF